MPSCDMCGKDGAGIVALVEGVELAVCRGCAKYGKVVRALRTEAPAAKRSPLQSVQKPGRQEEEDVEFVVEDFASRIRQKREQLNLTQKDFARMLNERESMIHHLENGTQRPSIELARKLERILRVHLVETEKEAPQEKGKSKVDSFTLGDFIKVKKSV